jgi:hypothetical protein
VPSVLANKISIEGVGPFTLQFLMTDYVEHLKQVLPDAGLVSGFSNVYNT